MIDQLRLFILIVLLIPGYYSLCGYAFLKSGTKDLGALSSVVLGFFINGFVAEILYFLKSDLLWILWGFPIAGIVRLALQKRWKEPIAQHLQVLAYYLPLILIMALVPMPGMFGWYGDWLGTVAQANVSTGLPIEWSVQTLLSSRPPLFGFALSMFRESDPWLIGIQAGSALTAACMAGLVIEWTESVRKVALSRVAKLALLLSAPVVLHSITMWAKPLTTCSLILSLMALENYRQTRTFAQLLTSASWFACAVATHESSILYVIFLPFLLPAPDKNCIRKLGKAIVSFAAMGMILVGTYRLMIILEFGLHSAIRENPALYYRDATGGGIGLFVRNLISTFTGYGFGFIPMAIHAALLDLIQKHELTLQTLVLWSNHVIPRFGGSLLFIAIPLLFGKAKGFADSISKLEAKLWGLVIAGLVVIGLHAILSPYASHTGIVQNGLLPLQMILLALVLTKADRLPLFQKGMSQAYYFITGAIAVCIIAVSFSTQFDIQFQELPELVFNAYPNTKEFISRGFETLNHQLSVVSFGMILGVICWLWTSRFPKTETVN